MNRTIKFRGKRLDNGEWIYGSLIQWGERLFTIHNFDGSIHIDPDTVGQFTGLLDKNGKEHLRATPMYLFTNLN